MVRTRFCVRFQSTCGTRRSTDRALGVVGHLGDGGRFQPQVHLELGGARERIDDGRGPQTSRGRVEALDHARGEIVAVEIAAETPLDTGTKNFDRHGLADATVDDDGLMDLGNGCGCDGWTELDEVILEPASECLLHRAPRLGHGERRQLVL